MKTMRKRTITILLSLIMIMAGTSLFAQRGRGLGPCGMGYGSGWGLDRSDFHRPAKGFGQFGMGQGMISDYQHPLLDLTDKQKEQLKELRSTYYKDMQSLGDQLREHAIDRWELRSDENVDDNAINESIDERADIMSKLIKKRAEFQKEFRNLLTDEQKEILDNSDRRFGMRKGMRNAGRSGRGFRDRGFYGGGFHRW